MLTSYLDVNFNKYSIVSLLTFVCTVFISSKNDIRVLNRSSKAGPAVKTITSCKDRTKRSISGIASPLHSCWDKIAVKIGEGGGGVPEPSPGYAPVIGRGPASAYTKF